jgi:predicted deacetylase
VAPPRLAGPARPERAAGVARAAGPGLAVALHDVEPATHARCVALREWLHDRGVERVTLLVVPAPRLHPFPARSPELAYWLLDRQDAGDAIAQHGLQHRQTRPGPLLARPLRHWQGGAAAEYAGMDAAGAAESVEAGRRVLVDAGLAPRGFVAPAYAYTGALRAVLAERFEWWATLLAIHGRTELRAPALGLGTSGPLKRRLSPLVVRAGAARTPALLRLDLHPADFDHPRHVEAVERVLARARDRVAVTYDDLVGAATRPAGFGPRNRG